MDESRGGKVQQLQSVLVTTTVSMAVVGMGGGAGNARVVLQDGLMTSCVTGCNNTMIQARSLPQLCLLIERSRRVLPASFAQSLDSQHVWCQMYAGSANNHACNSASAATRTQSHTQLEVLRLCRWHGL